MTFFSTLTCVGSSPAARQQNQRTTLTPGATDCGATMTGVGAGVPDASGVFEASSEGAAALASAVGCSDAGPAAVADGAAAVWAALGAVVGAVLLVAVLATGALLVPGVEVAADEPPHAATSMKTVAITSSRGHDLFIVLLTVLWAGWR